MSRSEKAVEIFKSGRNCCQAVVCSFCEDEGVDIETADRMGEGFGGGLKLAETCGAVTGAYMAISLQMTNKISDSVEVKSKTTESVRDFASKFKAINGSLLCKDLLGCDITTDEGRKVAIDNNLFGTKCVEMVKSAAKIVESLS